MQTDMLWFHPAFQGTLQSGIDLKHLLQVKQAITRQVQAMRLFGNQQECWQKWFGEIMTGVLLTAFHKTTIENYWHVYCSAGH